MIFVERIEEIFENERELWRSQAMQSQSASDDTLNSQLQQTLSKEQFDRYQTAGLTPVGIPTDDVLEEVVDYNKTQSMQTIPRAVLASNGKSTSAPLPSNTPVDEAVVVAVEETTVTTIESEETTILASEENSSALSDDETAQDNGGAEITNAEANGIESETVAEAKTDDESNTQTAAS
jgi:hypothetical protein